jgi:AraC-like DNA-binding protein
VFRCPVRFDRPRNAILLDRHYLDQAQPYADTRMLDLLREAADRRLLEQKGPSLPDQVRALLRSESDLRKIDAGRVAKMLRLHPRTFRRQLIAANAPWSEILDETRRRIACEELVRSDMSIREIAERLGFSEPSAFTRAFKRWTGKTPAKYSRAAAGR